MADVARRLISKIIECEDLYSATAAGIRANWFEDEDHRRAFGYILYYHEKHGAVPTKAVMRDEMPNYQVLTNIPEPYEYYLDRFRATHERAILVDTVNEAHTLVDSGDTKLAKEAISKGMLRLYSEVSVLEDSDVLVDYEERFDSYDEARNHVGELSGVATGFPTLDHMTGGYQDQQFVLFGGQPKQCKSFMLMRSAIGAQDMGKKVLFVSFEMSAKEQKARYDAITCGVDASHLLYGHVTNMELKRLHAAMRQRKNLQPFVIAEDISALTTVSSLAAKMDEHRPDIVFVDGVYLMDNEIGAELGTPRAYTAISRSLKRLAQRTKTPIVGSVQALSGKMGKDQQVTMHSLGWTSAWAQDSDLILGVEKIVEGGTTMVVLRVVAGRNVASGRIPIVCNFDRCQFDEGEMDEDTD
jgi:replicative DNA helicase